MRSMVTVTGSGQITIPAEIRRKHGIETGDRLVVSEDEQGQIVVTAGPPSISDLKGIFHPKPGVIADPDFGNIIREAMDDMADKIVANMRSHHDEP